MDRPSNGEPIFGPFFLWSSPLTLAPQASVHRPRLPFLQWCLQLHWLVYRELILGECSSFLVWPIRSFSDRSSPFWRRVVRICLVLSVPMIADRWSLIPKSCSSTHTAPPKTPSSTFIDQALLPVYVAAAPALTSVVVVEEVGVTLALATIMVRAVAVVVGALGEWTMYEDRSVAAVVETSGHLQH